MRARSIAPCQSTGGFSCVRELDRKEDDELQLVQELHQALVGAPGLCRFLLFDLAGRESFGFHLQVHVGVHLGRVETDMSQPSTNRVDVVPRPQKLS